MTSFSHRRWPVVNIYVRLKMPSSNPLSFLRPLYDIAVWQFILMSGYHATSGGESPRNTHIKFTWKMHEVVANFLCKLLEVRAFDHLQSKLLGEEVKSATGNWEVGQRATTKLVEWCQDQWRRKDPRLPRNNRELTQTTTATATRTSPNKRFNEQNNSSARAFEVLIHFLAVLCKTTT